MMNRARLDDLFRGLSIDRAWSHLEWLAREAPDRVSGTPDQERAARYFADYLDRSGLETSLDTFTAYRSVPLIGRLDVLAPVQRTIRSEACGHIRSTSPDGIVCDLVSIAAGRDEDYGNKDLNGCAVLTDIGVGPARPEKARIAASHGAAAIVFVNWGLPEFGTIPRGAIKCAWGNPTRASLADVPQIAALGISRADGEGLRRELDRGPVRVRVIAEATRDWGPLIQPWARLRAPDGDGSVLIVGGHHDAWRPGMTDNAAGNALMLELASMFASRRDVLRRDVIFAFWNGHEIGDYEGSTWFVDRYWDELDRHAVAYFNVDSVGMVHSSTFIGDSTPELTSFHRRVEEYVLNTAAPHRHLTRDNEHPFFPLGLPALEGRFHFSEEQVAGWGGARGGWWWHSEADTLDKVDRRRFEETVRVYVGYICGMCSGSLLPMDFQATAESIASRLAQAGAIAGDRFDLDLPVEPFNLAVERLDRHVESLANPTRTEAERVNDVLRKLSRILLPAFETFGGRYVQDRCSHPALAAPIPALHDLTLLGSADKDGELAHLLRY